MNLYDILLAKQFGGGNGGGGNDIFIVHATLEEVDDETTTVTIQENIDDIAAAASAEKPVLMYAYYEGEDSYAVLYLDCYTPANEENEANISFLSVPSVAQSAVMQTWISHGVDGTWYYTYREMIVE